jgi:hypothetical protein
MCFRYYFGEYMDMYVVLDGLGTIVQAVKFHKKFATALWLMMMWMENRTQGVITIYSYLYLNCCAKFLTILS